MSQKISNDKELYRKLCAEELDVPVFYKDWWLDAVCDGESWQVVMYRQDPNVVAVMTYFVKRKFVFNILTVPPLTKFMGPYFIRDFDDRKTQSILQKLVDKLPAISGFSQTLHYQIENWLPYKWKGFSQTTYYSYRLENLDQLEEVWQNIEADYRNNKIGKASPLYSIEEDLDFEQLYNLTLKPFKRQQIAMPVSKEILKRVVEACALNGAGKSLYARSLSGEVVAAVYLVWDQHSCYLLLAGENDQSRSDGAGVYLTWKAIEYAAENLKLSNFDFLGGMSENLERTRRQFGARQTPYFLISKYARLLKLMKNFS